VPQARRFDEVRVGDPLPRLAKVVKREEVKAYADASGDQNPLHQDDDFARSVGMPGIIAHGMFTMAHLTTAITEWAGDPGALVSIRVQFRVPVFMDEEIVAAGEVVDTDEQARTATLNVWVEVDRAGQRVLPIKNSRAVVRLA
jgi:acyl dehydratase